jgi:RNA polymerase sigma-70 factor (ECF subfamily)
MARSAARILDEYLVAAARAGDAAAFDRLARCWHSRLAAHARRLLGDAEAASDAVQQGWIEIARGLRRLQDDLAFPAWAYRIVSRVCYRQIGDAVQRRKLSEGVAAEPGVDAEDAGNPHDAELLRCAIRALPADQRAAIALFHFEELSVAEVAVALDVPAGTVKTRLMHARRKLRAALGGDE